ncbi:hypothetical protein YC2023_095842 [Brassica napus]
MVFYFWRPNKSIYPRYFISMGDMGLLLVNPKLVASLIIGEEFCMLTERAVEEPNLRRSAEMKNIFDDPFKTPHEQGKWCMRQSLLQELKAMRIQR